MGDQDDRLVVFVKFFKEAHNVFGRLRIEVARRFVSHDDVRVVDQGSGDGYSLALAAGEFIRLVMGPRFKTDGFQFIHGPFGPLFAADTGIDQGQGDVVEGCNSRQEVEVLEDEADVLVADDGEFIVIEVGNFLSSQLVRSGCRPVEAAEDVHQRRLPRAGRPHEGGKFPFFNVEGNAG